MRVVKEIPSETYNLTIYSWNNKFLIKFEQGGLEQTYKINETEILMESDWETLLNDLFIQKVLDRFDEMRKDFRDAVKLIH